LDSKTTLRDFISGELAGTRGGDLDDRADLLTSGVIDSLGVLRLVEFIEHRWGVRVPDEDVTLANFGSVDAIAEYLERRR
jgi:acyl carrier protein